MMVFYQQISPFLHDVLQIESWHLLNFSPQDTSGKLNIKYRKDLQVPHVSGLTFAS